MTGRKIHTLENQLYKVGLVFLLVFVAAVIILKMILPEGFELRRCQFWQATGYYCPGCGGTRALLHLLEGDIVTSFIYHPIVVYAFSILGVFMVSHTIEKIETYYYRRKGIVKDKLIIMGLKFRPWYLYGALVVTAINVTVKNILIYMDIWTN